jgi:hypothetical protein
MPGSGESPRTWMMTMSGGAHPKWVLNYHPLDSRRCRGEKQSFSHSCGRARFNQQTSKMPTTTWILTHLLKRQSQGKNGIVGEVTI